ncbi:MAG: sugar ABC transporter substrate-binding protein [Herbinix sp.]|nr:sugar ABC transporter substrate-binding protein [Herbinix sp.]
MKMKKSKITALILAVALVMSGCSSSDDKTQQTTDTTAQTSTNTVTEATTVPKTTSGDPVEITFTYWGSGAEKEAIEASIATFEDAYPNIKVKGMHIPSEDFLTKLNAMIAAGETPDISYSASWKCQFGEDGLIYNFFDLAKGDPDLSVDKYLDTCWWNWSPTESAGPIMANVTTSLMYNADMFKEANVDLPPTTVDSAWSWEEFVDVAQQLTIDSSGRNAKDPNFDSNNISQYGIMFSPNWNVYMPFVYSNGGGYLNEDMTGLGLNDPAAAKVIQNFADLINVYHVAPTAIQSNSMPAAATALASKQAAMYIDGSWNHLDLSKAGINWGVGVLPINQNYTTFLDGGSLIVFKATEHLKETMLLYKWITNPESSAEITEMFRTIWLPVQKEYYTDAKKLDFWASEDLPARPTGFKDAVVLSTYENQVIATEIDVKNFNEINTLVNSSLDQVWSGDKTAEEAMTEVKDQVDSLVDGTYSGNRS